MYARFMWVRREQLGLARGLGIAGWREVKQFLGSGGAMVFRQVGYKVFAPCRVRIASGVGFETRGVHLPPMLRPKTLEKLGNPWKTLFLC